MSDEQYLSRAFPKANGSPGMFLRDYFAGQALAGISADSTATDTMSHEKMAEWAYRQADAMLKAREASDD